jgi:hypothetical protein
MGRGVARQDLARICSTDEMLARIAAEGDVPLAGEPPEAELMGLWGGHSWQDLARKCSALILGEHHDSADDHLLQVWAHIRY